MKLNNMNHLLAATLVALSVSTIAFAAPEAPGKDSGKWHGGSPAQCKAKHEERRQQFAKELGLSADQQKKMDALRADFKAAHKTEFEAKRAQYKEIKALKESGAPQAQIDAKRAAIHQQFAGMKADREKLHEQIKAILTPEQVQKLEAMKAKHHHHRHEGPAPAQKTQ